MFQLISIFRHLKFCLPLACLAVSACREIRFPVPAQRTTSGYRLNAFIDIDPKKTSWPGDSIVSGVVPDDQSFGWSWTHPHAVFHFNLDEPHVWDFVEKITAVNAVLSKTGPQTVNFLVNGQKVRTIRLDHAGTYELQFALPGDLPADTTVEMTASPCLPQAEGPDLCVLLQRLGFTRELR